MAPLECVALALEVFGLLSRGDSSVDKLRFLEDTPFGQEDGLRTSGEQSGEGTVFIEVVTTGSAECCIVVAYVFV